jgi:predicted sugar kinase
VYGLADVKPVGPLTVTNGTVTLPFSATDVILGLGFDAYVELQRLEAGAADGTAQGKTKRVHSIAAHVWRSYGGEVGVYNHERGEYIMDPLKYETRTGKSRPVFVHRGTAARHRRAGL